jgi:hypothetical protein
VIFLSTFVGRFCALYADGFFVAHRNIL